MQFAVFSEVTMHGAPDSQELWKFRASMTADSARQAMKLVADTDALENKPGDSVKYAACRSSCWETHDYDFGVAAFDTPDDDVYAGEPVNIKGHPEDKEGYIEA